MKPILTTLAIAVLFSATLPAENWPAWRGPLGTSVSSDSGVPTEWSDDSNIAWKTKLRGLGVSSPIAWGNRVFVTYQVGRGTLRPTGFRSNEIWQRAARNFYPASGVTAGCAPVSPAQRSVRA